MQFSLNFIHSFGFYRRSTCSQPGVHVRGQQVRLPWHGSLGLQRTSCGLAGFRPFSQHLLSRIEEVNIWMSGTRHFPQTR
jgi:hypothetical protein